MKRYIIFLLFLGSVIPVFAGPPTLALMPLAVNNVPAAEIKVVEEYIASVAAASGTHLLLQAEQQEVVLDALGRDAGECADQECLLELGRLLSADRILTGSLGFLGERYILALKLLAVETGETVETASARYTDMPGLIGSLHDLLMDFLGDTGDGSRMAGTEDTLKLEAEYQKRLKRVNFQTFVSTIERYGLTDNLEAEPPERKLALLKAYIGNSTPRGIVLYGGPAAAYLQGNYNFSYLSDTPYPPEGMATAYALGACMGLLYRFPFNLGIGFFLELSGEHEAVEDWVDGRTAVNYLITVDIPVTLDGFGIEAGLGAYYGLGQRFMQPSIGVRVKNVVLRYSVSMNPDTRNHRASVLYTFPATGRL